jgi:hypothetical protein
MRTMERGQRDLFASGTAIAELQSSVRAKLVPLLRSLLAEAAGASRPGAELDTSGREDGDDQDHP